MANFARKATSARQSTANDGLSQEVVQALATVDDLRHDRTEDLRDFVKRKEAELEAHIAQAKAPGR